MGMSIGSRVAGACFSRPPAGLVPPGDVPEVVTRRFGEISVHVVNTGWVRVKRAHASFAGPLALRMPAIVFGRAWTPFMPVYVTVVEHPEGLFLVDAGLSEETLEPSHFACDPVTSFVYANLLDFRFAPEQRIDRRLAALGLDPSRTRGVVLTHRHADHADALVHLPGDPTVYVGAADWPSHAGALPMTREPTLVAVEGEPLGAFPHARPLTEDGRVAIVPLPGHSPGHLGVLVRTPALDVVAAGDATFSLEDLATGTLAGIVEQPAPASRTLGILREQLRAHPTSLVVSHDPRLARSFAAGETTVLPSSRREQTA